MTKKKKKADPMADAFAALTVGCSLAARRQWAAAEIQLAAAAGLAPAGEPLNDAIGALQRVVCHRARGAR